MADDEENENIKITGNESMKQSSSLLHSNYIYRS
jgi:hypothetical protein